MFSSNVTFSIRLPYPPYLKLSPSLHSHPLPCFTHLPATCHILIHSIRISFADWSHTHPHMNALQNAPRRRGLLSVLLIMVSSITRPEFHMLFVEQVKSRFQKQIRGKESTPVTILVRKLLISLQAQLLPANSHLQQVSVPHPWLSANRDQKLC